MPVVTLDPVIDYSGTENGTTISGDPYFDNSPVIPYIAPTPTYGGNVPVEPLEPIDPVVPIQNNPSNPINVLVGPIRENVSAANTNVLGNSSQIEAPIKEVVQMETIDTSINQPSTTTPVPPKPNTAIMGGGGKSGLSSVGSDLKTTDKKYWWWIAAAVVGIGLYSYKKSK